VKRLQARDPEKASGQGESRGVEAAFPHSSEIDVAALSISGEVSRPEKRIHMEVDDDGLGVKPPGHLADLEIERRRDEPGLEVDEEEGDDD
jgi:hypothetical protein